MCQWYVDFMTEIINLGRSWSPSLRNGSGVQPTHQRVSLRSLQKPVRFCSLLGVTYLQKAMRSWCTPTLASWTVVTCAVSTSRRAAPASGAIWSYTTTQSSSVPSAAHASKVRAGYRWCESAYVVIWNPTAWASMQNWILMRIRIQGVKSRVAGAANFWNFRLRLQLQKNSGSGSYP